MKYLHASWRMPYVSVEQKDKKNKHIFLDILHSTDERANLLLLKTEHSFVVLNKFPYNAGHLLVLPKREVADIAHLSSLESMDLWNTIQLSKKVVEHTLHPHGINIGFNLGSASGAGVPEHVHCHIVPRWDGDTNFMPVVAETKVLPIALEKLWEGMRSALPDVMNDHKA